MTTAIHRGNHVCYVAAERHLCADFLGHFADCGLARNERVLWLVDDDRAGRLASIAERHLRTAGGGQAHQVASSPATYLAAGRFDIADMLTRYAAAVHDSLAAGFSGLRVLADTSWLLESPESFEAFLSYEHQVNDLFSERQFAAVCHYDPEQVPAEWLQSLGDAHPLHATAGDPGLDANGCRITQTASGMVTVSGELDYRSTASLPAVLADWAPPEGDLHLDLSGVTFIDVVGTRALVTAATAVRPRRTVLQGGPRLLRVILDAAGWGSTPGLVLADPEAEHRN